MRHPLFLLIVVSFALIREPPTLAATFNSGDMINLQVQLQWSTDLDRWDSAGAPLNVPFILSEGTEKALFRFQTISISENNGLVSLQLQIHQILNSGGWNPSGSPIRAQFTLPQGTQKAFFRFFVQQLPDSLPPGDVPSPPTTPPPSEPPPSPPPEIPPPPPPLW